MPDQPKSNPGDSKQSSPEDDQNVVNEDSGEAVAAGSTEHSPPRQQQTQDSAIETSSPPRERVATSPFTPPRNPNLSSTATKSPILLEALTKTPPSHQQESRPPNVSSNGSAPKIDLVMKMPLISRLLFNPLGDVTSDIPFENLTSEQIIKLHPRFNIMEQSESSENPEAAKPPDSEKGAMPKDSKQSDGKVVEESVKQSNDTATNVSTNSEAPSTVVTGVSARSDAISDDSNPSSNVPALKRGLKQLTSSADSNPTKTKRARCSDTLSGVDAALEIQELVSSLIKEEDSDTEEEMEKST